MWAWSSKRVASAHRGGNTKYIAGWRERKTRQQPWMKAWVAEQGSELLLAIGVLGAGTYLAVGCLRALFGV